MAVNRIKKYIARYQPELSKEEWAYIAGIIDGEGTISIIRVNKKRRGLHWYILQPTIQVSNTSEELIRWLGEKLDMKVNNRARSLPPAYKGRQRTREEIAICYVVALFGYKVYSILKNICPYLIIKRGQCELTMQYIESRMKLADDQYNCPYTDEDEQLWLAVRKLNRKPSASYPDVVGLTLKSTTSQQQPETSLPTES